MKAWIFFFLVQGAFATKCAFSEVSCAGANEQACNPTQYDDNGCPLTEGYCEMLMSPWELDRDGNACPVYCPVECNWEQEMICPGQFNPMGCRDMDMCVPMGEPCPEEQFDHRGCPIPQWWVECPEGMMTCPGEFGPDGCMLDAYCAEECTWELPQYDDRGCLMQEPILCAEGDMPCGIDFDERGCEIDMGCVPMGTECPMPTRDPMGCLIFNDMCDYESEIMCPMTMNSNQCMDAPMCVPMDNGMCPPESNCPMTCDAMTEMMCSMASPDGCNFDYCMPATMPNEFNMGTCVAYCPAECNWESEMMCPGLLGPDGCRMPDTCVPMGEMCPEQPDLFV